MGNGKSRIFISLFYPAFTMLLIAGILSCQKPGNSTGNKANKNPSGNIKEEVQIESKKCDVIVYYFHTTYRCDSCMQIEQLTAEALDEEYSEEMKDGFVEYNVVNMEEAKNNHFIQDYKLYTKSVIVADIEEGKQIRWKNLIKVWSLINNKKEFKKYIKSEVKDFLED